MDKNKKPNDMVESDQDQDDPYLNELDSSLEDLLEDEPTPEPLDETIDDSEEDEAEDYEDDGEDENEEIESTATASFFEPPTLPPQAPSANAPLARMTTVPRTSNLPLEVRVVIAEHSMSLAELLAVQPGTLIDLQRALNPTVSLMVQDKCVARGELVVIDGRLGVRVLNIMEVA